MRRLRILMSAFCCDAFDVSEDLDGFNWVKHLAPYCDITLFTLGRPGRRCGTEDMEGVRTYRFPQTWLGRVCPQLEKTVLPSYPPFVAYSLWKAAAQRRREAYDLVHQVTPAALRFPSGMALLKMPFILGPVGGGLAVPAAFRAEVDEPFYFRLRGFDRIRMRLDPALVLTLSRATRILVQGEYAVDMLPRWARSKAVVMLGAGVESLPAAVERPARPGEIRILYVGRVVATKGLRFLLRALTRLGERAKWRLTVVGDGPDMGTIKGMAARLAGRGEVEFAGWLPREEVERRYDEADVFCFPSLKEAGGNVVLEAMSHGLPVIVIDNGGPGTTVTEECGFKIRARDVDQVVEEIAEAIRALAESPELRARMGEAARRRVESEYLWSVKVDRMLAIYEDAVAQGAGNAPWGTRG